MFGFFGGGMGGGSFEARYRAMPVAFIDKLSAEYGDKVILPPSALDRLASLHIEYPMLFKVENPALDKFTHCGVLEFIAEEGVVYMPHWMMQNLLLQVGDMVKFRNVSLPKGTYVKLQPHTSDFLDISNPKAVLERTLRSYSCLTIGDVFVVNYNNKNYEIEVKEAKPANAISIIETDCQVDFEAPRDYKEPERVVPKPAPPPPTQDGQASGSTAPDAPEEDSQEPKFTPFVGSGRRLDGKPGAPTTAPLPASSSTSTAPKPAVAAAASSSGGGSAASGTSSKAGTFVSTGNRLLDKLQRDKMQAGGAASGAPRLPPPPPKEEEKEEPKSNFSAFSGKAYTLK